MRKYIISTTIHEPTPALLAYANKLDWKLIVVGDLKTPHDKYAGFNYLSPEMQESIDRELSDLIGWNCIQRRNIGYLQAIREGAQIIATVDDDNLPNAEWGYVHVGERVKVEVHDTKLPAFDPLWATNHQELWHRGFPPQWVKARESSISYRQIIPDVQAGLWNGDPDIDGICRLMNPGKVWLRCALFTSSKPSPFNSQNTIMGAEAMKHYFCFPHVGRMDDIYASYVMQARGFKVLYEPPTVFQDRAEHGADCVKDIEHEIHGYRHCADLITSLASDPDSWRKYIPERAAKAFDRYRELVT